MDTEDTSRVNPPYIPLMTLENFAGKLKAAVVPPVIDSSLTQSMSGGMAGALMSALKFLGLVDAAGKTQASLKKLVAAHGTDTWKTTQAELLLPAYKEIIGDLDLTTTTPAMLEECFRKKTKATGQVLEKAIRFYLAILTAADSPISPLLKTRKPRGAPSQRRPTRTTSARKQPSENYDSEDIEDNEDEENVGIKPLKLRLPVPGKQQEILFIVPGDLTLEDWTFLHPIFSQYVDRMLKENDPIVK
jgi:Family of unknown function (DUF5343)